MKQIIMMTKDGCGSCKEFKPKAKEIAQELGYEFRVAQSGNRGSVFSLLLHDVGRKSHSAMGWCCRESFAMFLTRNKDKIVFFCYPIRNLRNISDIDQRQWY